MYKDKTYDPRIINRESEMKLMIIVRFFRIDFNKLMISL